jgi:hypothetical protein
MVLIDSVRRMNKRLRVMLIATALLIVPQIGQFAAIRDLNLTGHESNLAILFQMASVFFLPTSIILSGAILATIRKNWREHQNLVILGLVNIVISINLIWFFVSACSWAMVFGLYLHTCH